MIVLGRGIDTWSQRYRTRTHCIIGIGEVSGLLRLYPLFAHEDVQKFDVVQAAIQDEQPERHRTESRKIYPNSTRVIAHKGERAEQRNIIKSLCGSDEFLHGEGWRSRTVGVIKPLSPHFWITKKGKIMVRYRCGIPDCKGHLNEVLEVMRVDKLGRRWRPKVKEVEKLITKLKNKRLYFVLGTHRNYPHRWILVAVHAF